MRVTASVSGVSIRLTFERLAHIQRRHPEFLAEGDWINETVSAPDYVQEGDSGTLIAIRHYAKTPLTEKFCAVVYKEVDRSDGFVVTAYFSRQPSVVRRIVWKR